MTPCPDCDGTGRVVFVDTEWIDFTPYPRYTDVPCACNPDPTDEDAPEPYEDYPGHGWYSVLGDDWDRMPDWYLDWYPDDYVLPADLLA